MPDGETIAPPPPTTGAILHKTARGAGWIIGWRMARRLLGFINLLVLARLLVPADFGVVALAAGVAGTLNALATVGVEDALVREKSVDRGLYDTGFTMNVLRGLLTAGVLAAIAVPAAAFFRDPRLVDVMLVLAATNAVGAFANIGTVDFRRDLAFQKEFVLLVIPRVVGFLVTLGVAIVWRSYWALIAGIVAGQALALVQSYAMHPYRPRFSLRAWRGLAGFSVWTWALTMALAVRDRTDAFIIGHLLGEASVGDFAMGVEVANLPSSELVGPLTRACYSGFAASRHAGQDSGEVYLRVVAAVALVTMPACIGISAVADPVVWLMLGAKWLQVIPLVRVLSLFTATAVIGALSSNLLTVYGLLTTQFRITIVVAVVRVGLLLLWVPQFGVMGAVLAAGVGSVVEYAAYLLVTCRKFHISGRAFVRRLWRVALGVAAMSAVLAATGLGWASATDGAALVQVRVLTEAATLGIIMYSVVVLGAWIGTGRPDGAEADMLQLLRKRLPGARPA